MWRRSRRKPLRGFSLAEASVSLTLLIIVMVVSLTLLFSMRSFAERQQFAMEPRQTARRAVEYLSYFLEGAADLNTTGGMPNAIVTYYNSDASNDASLVQASFNNLTGTETGNAAVNLATALGTIPSTNFGDLGTDILSVAVPTIRPGKYAVFGAFPANGANQDLWINFREGCGTDDATNLALFRQATFEAGGVSPNNLTVIDNDGAWAYMRINTYVASDCASPNQVIHVTVSPGQAPGSGGPIAPPYGPLGNPAVGNPAFLVTGLQYFSFRVRTDAATGIPSLEQKNGLFDPATDNPGAAFVPVIENVEDFQVAYMYFTGEIWNSSVQQMSAGMLNCTTCLADIPIQSGPKAASFQALDVLNVAGLRFSVVGRSRPMTLSVRTQTNISPSGAPGATGNRHFRPAIEDHAAAAAFDNFEHARLTTTLMLRNRILGN
jgi:hypothetical protein